MSYNYTTKKKTMESYFCVFQEKIGDGSSLSGLRLLTRILLFIYKLPLTNPTFSATL